MYEVVELGASRVDPKTGFPVAQASTPISDDGQDAEPFGEVALFFPLGHAALPAPRTTSKWAEGFVVRDAAGLDAVCLGQRDQRAASVYGNLAPGDTALFSTGPSNSSQLLLKEETRQACMLTLDTGDKHMAVVLDGTKDTISITGFDQAISMTRDDGITIGNSKGNIRITADGKIMINGVQVMIGTAANAATGAAYSAAGPANLISTSVFISPT